VRDYLQLMKPRVMSLVVFSGFAALVVAPVQPHPLLSAVAILCIAIASGASGAINMWYDRDIDAVMPRTCKRPIPEGRVDPAEALAFGIVLAIGSVVIMGVALNWLAAGLLASAILFYVFVYTIWLKRRTPQNIVIGGAAGAFPPMIGWAAATGEVSLASVVLFAIVFVWTPPHFWALALFRSADYARAGVPMLPVVAGVPETTRQILLYTIATVALSLLPTPLGIAGWTYFAVAAALGGVFVAGALALRREPDEANAKRVFGFSVLYLFLLFALIVVDRATGALP